MVGEVGGEVWGGCGCYGEGYEVKFDVVDVWGFEEEVEEGGVDLGVFNVERVLLYWGFCWGCKLSFIVWFLNRVVVDGEEVYVIYNIGVFWCL